jgi:hypothetical protein
VTSPVVNGFADRLPDSVHERIVGVANANLLWEEPAAVADRLGNALDEPGAGTLTSTSTVRSKPPPRAASRRHLRTGDGVITTPGAARVPGHGSD